MLPSKTAASFAALILLVSLTACAGAGETYSASTSTGSSAGLGVDADAMLAKYDIKAPDSATDLIEQLQAQPLADRPDGLMASVRVNELLLVSGDDQAGPEALRIYFRASLTFLPACLRLP
ncbi:hypothetical protein [Cryobacterium lactosi]|uniref:hypothetical protein n=1 Tax=Cryobacterium lactosi TaxID=1259202 RepID=UPI0030B9E6B1